MRTNNKSNKNNIGYNFIQHLYELFIKYINKSYSHLEKVRIFHHLIFKNHIIKIIIFVILFVIFFDKSIMVIIFTIIYCFKKYILKHENLCLTENFNNVLDSSVFEPSNNNISQYSNVFKYPELNLKSYNNVLIDPSSNVLLENNKFLPECCLYNTEYSTSKGCACITPDQQDYLRTRATNNSFSEEYDYKNLYFSPTYTFKYTFGKGITKNDEKNTFIKNSFRKNDEKYIIDYEPLTATKKSEFLKLTNMSSYTF